MKDKRRVTTNSCYFNNIVVDRSNGYADQMPYVSKYLSSVTLYLLKLTTSHRNIRPQGIRHVARQNISSEQIVYVTEHDVLLCNLLNRKKQPNKFS